MTSKDLFRLDKLGCVQQPHRVAGTVAAARKSVNRKPCSKRFGAPFGVSNFRLAPPRLPGSLMTASASFPPPSRCGVGDESSGRLRNVSKGAAAAVSMVATMCVVGPAARKNSSEHPTHSTHPTPAVAAQRPSFPLRSPAASVAGRGAAPLPGAPLRTHSPAIVLGMPTMLRRGARRVRLSNLASMLRADRWRSVSAGGSCGRLEA
jgi:hypothetical protein